MNTYEVQTSTGHLVQVKADEWVSEDHKLRFIRFVKKGEEVVQFEAAQFINWSYVRLLVEGVDK